MSLYIVDSNFFIQAHRAYYPLDVITSFWAKISDLSKQGIIKSIDKVKIEIYDNSSHEDDLKYWCKNNLPSDFFINTESAVVNYALIANWANSMNQHYKQNAIEEFLSTDLADPWLVAYAKGQDITIVTYEKSEPNRKNRIKIPEVCNHFGVRYINTVEMLRELSEII
jgi:hypothetical protein